MSDTDQLHSLAMRLATKSAEAASSHDARNFADAAITLVNLGHAFVHLDKLIIEAVPAQQCRSNISPA